MMSNLRKTKSPQNLVSTRNYIMTFNMAFIMFLTQCYFGGFVMSIMTDKEKRSNSGSSIDSIPKESAIDRHIPRRVKSGIPSKLDIDRKAGKNSLEADRKAFDSKFGKVVDYVLSKVSGIIETNGKCPTADKFDELKVTAEKLYNRLSVKKSFVEEQFSLAFSCGEDQTKVDKVHLKKLREKLAQSWQEVLLNEVATDLQEFRELNKKGLHKSAKWNRSGKTDPIFKQVQQVLDERPSDSSIRNYQRMMHYIEQVTAADGEAHHVGPEGDEKTPTENAERLLKYCKSARNSYRKDIVETAKKFKSALQSYRSEIAGEPSKDKIRVNLNEIYQEDKKDNTRVNLNEIDTANREGTSSSTSGPLIQQVKKGSPKVNVKTNREGISSKRNSRGSENTNSQASHGNKPRIQHSKPSTEPKKGAAMSSKEALVAERDFDSKLEKFKKDLTENLSKFIDKPMVPVFDKLKEIAKYYYYKEEELSNNNIQRVVSLERNKLITQLKECGRDLLERGQIKTSWDRISGEDEEKLERSWRPILVSVINETQECIAKDALDDMKKLKKKFDSKMNQTSLQNKLNSLDRLIVKLDTELEKLPAEIENLPGSHLNNLILYHIKNVTLGLFESHPLGPVDQESRIQAESIEAAVNWVSGLPTVGRPQREYMKMQLKTEKEKLDREEKLAETPTTRADRLFDLCGRMQNQLSVQLVERAESLKSVLEFHGSTADTVQNFVLKHLC